MNLLLKLRQPSRSQMDILEHNPRTSLDTLLHSLIRKVKTFGTTNGHRDQLIVGLLADLLNLETGIKTWGAGQKNRLFGFAGLDCALEFNGIVISTLWT